MTCFSSRIVAVAALLAVVPVMALGARPSDQLFPSSTTAYVSVGDWPELRESWNKTQLSELMTDPVMVPTSGTRENRPAMKASSAAAAMPGPAARVCAPTR